MPAVKSESGDAVEEITNTNKRARGASPSGGINEGSAKKKATLPSQGRRIDALEGQVGDMQKSLEEILQLMRSNNKDNIPPGTDGTAGNVNDKNDESNCSINTPDCEEELTKGTQASASAFISSESTRPSNAEQLVFTGACDEEGNSKFENQNAILCSGRMKIGLEVSQKIKEMIWTHKYVDFSSLIAPDVENEYALSFNSTSNQAQLKRTPKPKRPLNKLEWVSAFDIFLAVYIDKYPTQVADLLTYGQHIKEMMRRNEDWYAYDIKFRKGRESMKYSWSSLRVDLMLGARGTTDSTRTFREERRIPRGFCFKFHTRKQMCHNPACRYKHTCPRCSNIHPLYTDCGIGKAPINYQRRTNNFQDPSPRKEVTYSN